MESSNNHWIIDELRNSISHMGETPFTNTLLEELLKGASINKLARSYKTVLADIIGQNYGRRNSLSYRQKVKEVLKII